MGKRLLASRMLVSSSRGLTRLRVQVDERIPATVVALATVVAAILAYALVSSVGREEFHSIGRNEIASIGSPPPQGWPYTLSPTSSSTTLSPSSVVHRTPGSRGGGASEPSGTVDSQRRSDALVQQLVAVFGVALLDRPSAGAR